VQGQLLLLAYLKAGVLARSFVTGQIDEDFPWVSSVLANAELVPKFRFALLSSGAALPKVTSNFPPKRSTSSFIKISS
jgi:hypothetical protein